MLSSHSPLIRTQNSSLNHENGTNPDNFFLSQNHKSTFLPANHYPMPTPGFTAHWTDSEVLIVRRIENAAKIVFNAKVADIPVDLIFDPLPSHERIRLRSKSKGSSSNGIFKNLTSWLSKWTKPTATLSNTLQESPTSIVVTLLPLLFDSTLFDVLIIYKRIESVTTSMYGFSRIRQFIFGKDHCISAMNAVIPALPATNSECKFCQWKSFLFAIEHETGKIRYINLMKIEAEWIEVSPFEIVKNPIQNILLLCNLKSPDSQKALLLLESSMHHLLIEFNVINEFDLQFKRLSNIDLAVSNAEFGYFEGNQIFIQHSKSILSKHHTVDGTSSIIHTFNEESKFDKIVYLFPWGQDLKISSLFFTVDQAPFNDGYNIYISVYALEDSDPQCNGMDSRQHCLNSIHQFNEFKIKRKITSIFVSSSLELFMQDESGHVFVYSGLLQCTDWRDFGGIGRKTACENDRETLIRGHFEFANWFNILSDDFPFKSEDFYQSRRGFVKGKLFIDEALERLEGCEIAFPPRNWKELGQMCGKLDQSGNLSLLLYYLMASSAPMSRLQAFSGSFGLTGSEISMLELAYAADHGDGAGSVKIFCTRKHMALPQKSCSFLIGDICSPHTFRKLVKMLSKEECNANELKKLIQFASGRLVSLDTILEDSEVLGIVFDVMLRLGGMRVSLEWIKGLFAWLRPDDRSALIPVSLLHQRLVRGLLDVLLGLESNSLFKELGSELVEKVSLLEPEMLQSVLKHLKTEIEDSGNDRSAWLLTMLCASRGHLHGLLLKYDFSSHVKDPEVLKGIDRIKELILPMYMELKSQGNVEEDDYSFIDADDDLSVPGMIICDDDNSKTPIKRINSPQLNTPNKPHPKLLEIYSRTPKSSPGFTSLYRQHFSNSRSQIPSSPTFTPRHFPSKRPTTLSQINRQRKMSESDDGDSKEEQDGEEYDDPFHADLIRFGGGGGKKRLFIKEEIVNSPITETSSPSILTKEPVRILETVNLNLNLDLKEPKRKRPRIKRNIN
jgi:hypothetical protein